MDGKQLKQQMWYESEDQELLLAQLLCLDVESKAEGRTFARLMKCHGAKGSQAWMWTSQVCHYNFTPRSMKLSP